MLKDVRVGNVSINAPAKSYSSGHFIVDSGTTDSYFPVSMKSAFEAAFEHVAGLKYQTSGASCTGLTDEQVEKLPTLQVVLESEDGGDLVLDVTPEQYLIQEKHGYCANVFLSEFSGGGASSCCEALDDEGALAAAAPAESLRGQTDECVMVLR